MMKSLSLPVGIRQITNLPTTFQMALVITEEASERSHTKAVQLSIGLYFSVWDPTRNLINDEMLTLNLEECKRDLKKIYQSRYIFTQNIFVQF